MPGEVRSVESSHLPPRTPIGADEESSGGNPRGPPYHRLFRQRNEPHVSKNRRATQRVGLSRAKIERSTKIEKLTRELYWLRQRAHSSFNELMANIECPLR